MDKLIILGLIGYLIWSHSSDQTTEPAKTIPATEPAQTQNVQQTETENILPTQETTNLVEYVDYPLIHFLQQQENDALFAAQIRPVIE